jgi:hypothetical protein
MSGQQGATAPKNRALWWTASAVTMLSALFLLTGLLVPGFMLDESESSPMSDDSGTPSAAPTSELPWADLNPAPQRLTPDAAVRRMVTLFVGGLNDGRAADAVAMLCPDKRRLIRGSVVWTATHDAQLRATTPLQQAARPGYITIRFAGAIQRHQRRGVIGLDADQTGRPRCVSTFYSVG